MRQRRGDFRGERAKLPPEAFAIAEGPDEAPSDLIPADIWSSITSLPDDVSLRTSDHFGSALSQAWQLWGNWIEVVGAVQEASQKPAESPLAHVACDVTDYLQASIFNALVGFYRLAFTSLRAVVENMTIGMHLELSVDVTSFSRWLAGDELRFGWPADHAMQNDSVRSLEVALRATGGDDLFHQRSGADAGGLARRLFGRISSYAHGNPQGTDAATWHSNGPVFAPDAFEAWTGTFLSVFALALVETQLSRPQLTRLGFGSSLTLQQLFLRVNQQLPASEDSRTLMDAVARTLWQPAGNGTITV